MLKYGQSKQGGEHTFLSFSASSHRSYNTACISGPSAIACAYDSSELSRIERESAHSACALLPAARIVWDTSSLPTRESVESGGLAIVSTMPRSVVPVETSFVVSLIERSGRDDVG
jgi:hypothetical protein